VEAEVASILIMARGVLAMMMTTMIEELKELQPG
jgi:hypothetical protein